MSSLIKKEEKQQTWSEPPLLHVTGETPDPEIKHAKNADGKIILYFLPVNF